MSNPANPKEVASVPDTVGAQASYNLMMKMSKPYVPSTPSTDTPTKYLGGCNCAWKAPTVPVYRGPNTHLDDCPARDSGYPVGGILNATSIAAQLEYLKRAVNGFIEASAENARNERGLSDSIVKMQRGQLLLTLSDALRHVCND